MDVYIPMWFIRPQMVIHPSTNRDRRRATTSIHINSLPYKPRRHTHSEYDEKELQEVA